MNKEIIVNHTPVETRVAILEKSYLTELLYERSGSRGIVGNIYKGQIIKVLPGMEAAFVDIGTEKSSFLHVDDVLDGPSLPDEVDDNSNGETSLVSRRDKKVPIDQLIQEKQEIIVQVSKGPIGTKGARITSHISIPGRLLVLMPYADNVSISRQITSSDERSRLRKLVNALRPNRLGFIVRTIAESSSDQEIKNDINYLTSIWNHILENSKKVAAPYLVHEDLRMTYRLVRETLDSDVKHLVIDDEDEFKRVHGFVKDFLPRYLPAVTRYKGRLPIYEKFNIEDEIDKIFDNKVWLKSGGYLIINQTEALTAIDVNTGRFVGKANHEETILTTNLEAAKEVVSQLRLRNIGGIIIIDFIDMNLPENRNNVYKVLKEELRLDRTRSKILQISEIGLVEMTRKRDRENLERLVTSPCPYCAGKGRVKSLATVTAEVVRETLRVARRNFASLAINAHPDLVDYLRTEQSELLKYLAEKIKRPIDIQSCMFYNHEQFEIFEY